MFHALGRALDAAFGRPARWLYHHVLVRLGHDFTVPFGGFWPLVAGALALALGVVVAVLLVRRRSRPAVQPEQSERDAPLQDPGELEAEAEAAERAGDHERAVRLRFRAGLLHLVRRGALPDADARTDRQLATMLGSATFARLARRHEHIVYGRENATPEDSATARRDWPRVLQEAGSSKGSAR